MLPPQGANTLWVEHMLEYVIAFLCLSRFISAWGSLVYTLIFNNNNEIHIAPKKIKTLPLSKKCVALENPLLYF